MYLNMFYKFMWYVVYGFIVVLEFVVSFIRERFQYRPQLSLVTSDCFTLKISPHTFM